MSVTKKLLVNTAWFLANLGMWYAAAVFMSGIMNSYYNNYFLGLVLNTVFGLAWWFYIIRKGLPYIDTKWKIKR